MKEHKEKVGLIGHAGQGKTTVCTDVPETKTMIISSRGYEKTARLVENSLDTIPNAASTATRAFGLMRETLEPFYKYPIKSKHNKAAALRFKARHKK